MNPILFLFGFCKISADAVNASRLLNLCLENSFSFSRFRGREDGGISFLCPLLTAKKLLQLAEERTIVLEVSRYGGLPLSLLRRTKRYGLIVGGICATLLLFFSGRYVWDVRVTGNERLTGSEVLEELSACGFGIGSPLRGFHAGELENRVLLQSDDLAWLSVHIDGTVAMVQVLERVERPEDTPVKPANLIASCDGQIESVELLRGDCVVKVGQAVRSGELLVSGVYDSQTVGVRFTRAAGRILARTEHHYQIEIPLETTQKVYTEEKKSGIWLNFFQKSVKIFKSTGNEGGSCDIIKREKSFAGIGLQNIPVWLTVETSRFYEEIPVKRTEEQALLLAYESLAKELESLSADAQLLRKEIATTLTDRSVILDCTVLCIEDIAVQSEFEVSELWS